MSNLTQLEQKLHGYQVILWLKQTFKAVMNKDNNDSGHNEANKQEQWPVGDVQEELQPYRAKIKAGSGPVRPKGCGVSKSSVYKVYIDMCHGKGQLTLFTCAVVGKMVKCAFSNVCTKH